MQARVLKFDSETGDGVLRRENGTRYSFSRDHWQGERDPVIYAEVEFTPVGGKAWDVRPHSPARTKSKNALLERARRELGDGERYKRAYSKVRSNRGVRWLLSWPETIGALLIIAGWLIAGHFLLVRHLVEISRGFADVAAITEGGIGFVRWFGTWSMLLLYAVPCAAIALILRSWRQAASPTLKLTTGLIAILMPIVVPVFAYCVIWVGLPPSIQEIMSESPARADQTGVSLTNLLDPDLGFFIIMMGGVIVLLNRFGLLKPSPKAEPSPAAAAGQA